MPISSYPEDEVVQRGQALCEQQIRAAVDTAENKGKMLVINIETGEWEMDADDVTAAQRAKVHFGDALLFSMRIGCTGRRSSSSTMWRAALVGRCVPFSTSLRTTIQLWGNRPSVCAKRWSTWVD